MIDNKILQIVSREEVVSLLKSKFSRIKKEDCIKLAAELLTSDSNNRKIEVRRFKDKYKEFVRRNPTLFDTENSGKDIEFHFLKQKFANELFDELVILLEDIGSSLKDIQDSKDS